MQIFLSYRRQDTQAITDRIYEHLAAAFGRQYIFKDVDNIPPGKDFRAVLQSAVNKTKTVLVIVGRDWANIQGADGKPRLHDPADFVRIEVESALKNPKIDVIPILVNGAQMPSAALLPASLHELLYRNAVQVRNDPDFSRDMHHLIKHLGGKSQAITTAKPSNRWGLLRRMIVLIIVTALLGGGGYGIMLTQAGGNINTCTSRQGLLLPGSEHYYRVLIPYRKPTDHINLGITISDEITPVQVELQNPNGGGYAWGNESQSIYETGLSSGTYTIVLKSDSLAFYELNLYGTCL